MIEFFEMLFAVLIALFRVGIGLTIVGVVIVFSWIGFHMYVAMTTKLYNPWEDGFYISQLPRAFIYLCKGVFEAIKESHNNYLESERKFLDLGEFVMGLGFVPLFFLPLLMFGVLLIATYWMTLELFFTPAYKVFSSLF